MGTHGTVRPKEMLDVTGVKAIIVGEPEASVVEIASGKPLKSISGIAFDEKEKLVINPPRDSLDLTGLPMPAYDLIDISLYRYEVLGDRFALLEASRCCPYRCMFCVKSMYGGKFRSKNPDRFIREIDYIIDEVGARTAYFIDLEFTVNQDMVKAVCEHLIRRGTPLSWCCQTRTDSVDEPLLRLMKRAGCRIVHFGVETGSEKIRETLNKGISRRQIEEGLRAARAVGMQTVCFFMFGLPEENRSDMEETIRFAKQLNPTYASFHIALPYPGTDFYDQVESELHGDLFPNSYTGVVSYEDLENMTRRAFRTYYLRPRYIAGRLRDRDFSTFYRQAKFFASYLKSRLWS